METKHPSMLGLLLETHIGLERQGPGSAEAIFPVQLLVLICSLILLISLIEMQKSEIWKKFREKEGYALDITDKRLHHEIYLSDARRVAPERLKTVIRHPIKRR